MSERNRAETEKFPGQDLVLASIRAREISSAADVAYWTKGLRGAEDIFDMKSKEVHASFAKMAAELGYAISKIEPASAAAPAMTVALKRIAEDFIADRPSEQALAIEEMRECARAALSLASGE